MQESTCIIDITEEITSYNNKLYSIKVSDYLFDDFKEAISIGMKEVYKKRRIDLNIEFKINK